MKPEVVVADYHNTSHARDLVYLLDGYAADPMGGLGRLSDAVRQNLAQALSEVPQAFSLLCYVDSQPAALANCFWGFSTFKCRPLVNIHDLYVAAQFRGHRLSTLLLNEVEKLARERGCCKVTLEVLEGNKPARSAYDSFGFLAYELDPALGRALFLEKPLV